MFKLRILMLAKTAIPLGSDFWLRFDDFLFSKPFFLTCHYKNSLIFTAPNDSWLPSYRIIKNAWCNFQNWKLYRVIRSHLIAKNFVALFHVIAKQVFLVVTSTGFVYSKCQSNRISKLRNDVSLWTVHHQLE